MITIPDPLQSAARARPDHPAFICAGETITYRALAARAAITAGTLLRAGIEPGDRIALIGDPGLDWLCALWALAQCGAVVAPINPRAPLAETTAALAAIRPRAVWAPADHPLPPDTRRLMTADCGPPAPERPWPLEEARLTLLTSGTTAAPRPITLTTAQLVFSAFGSAIRLGHDPADRWLCCLPLHHIGGLSIPLRCALYATTLDLHPRFDPAAIAATLDAGTTTHASLTPAMLAAVLDARPERPFPAKLRALLIGGARTPPDLIDRCRALAAPLARTWGMTETASQIATTHPGDYTPGAPPHPFAHVTTDPDGTLIIDGPIAPNPLRTHDRGHITPDGRIHVTDRADDIIQSGGLKLAPAEIEDTLRRHPAIADAAVIAMPDPTWGQRPRALLVPRGDTRPTPAELRAWCHDHLSHPKTPDDFTWIEALPRDALGKLRRRELRHLRTDSGTQGQTP